MEQRGRTGQRGRGGRPGGLAPLNAGDPHRIGDYRLIARLGEGGMGKVFLARSDRGRTVAVKLVREELAHQEEFRARFRREVRAAQQVGGEWTAPVLDADTEAGTPWVATGYIAGPSLQQVVGGSSPTLGSARAGGTPIPLPERTVRILAAGLARALQSIHAAGIVHRDLKPSNVLLTIDGPRVIDFGIARALEAVADNGVTHTGAAVGSPAFMAPEQVRGDTIGPPCDVFCLGSVLAYAATGRQPFGPATSGVHAVMYRIAQEEPDLSALPPGLHALVAACLAKDPAQRPTPAQLLAMAEDSVTEDAAEDEPWLPGALIAQLGRHAVELLEAEHPESDTDGAPTRIARGGAASPFAPHAAEGPGGHAPPAPGAPVPRRRRRVNAGLVAAVALVLLGAGGVSAYALLSGKDDGVQPAAANGGKPGRGAAQPAGNRRIPANYLGTWESAVSGATDARRFTLKQGAPDDPVLTLTINGATFACTFAATLKDPGPPVRLERSTVVSGEAPTCMPGPSSRLELVDGELRRVTDDGKAPLMYRRTG
ncbi:serine/threonine-protein kinase [Streptomyces sp. NPDC048483]|uniref:serine/threonine-protein kinase n=1 Tax=Streptomyces sp. NPDC048483 TaxID=3154927 RepID=UPI003421D656